MFVSTKDGCVNLDHVVRVRREWEANGATLELIDGTTAQVAGQFPYWVKESIVPCATDFWVERFWYPDELESVDAENYPIDAHLERERIIAWGIGGSGATPFTPDGVVEAWDCDQFCAAVTDGHCYWQPDLCNWSKTDDWVRHLRQQLTLAVNEAKRRKSEKANANDTIHWALSAATIEPRQAKSRNR